VEVGAGIGFGEQAANTNSMTAASNGIARFIVICLRFYVSFPYDITKKPPIGGFFASFL